MYKIPLPRYQIPYDLRVSLNKGEPSDHLEELLRSELTETNYQEKYSALLHIEEMQMEVDIRHYDVENATMVKDGPFLALKVGQPLHVYNSQSSDIPGLLC